MGLFTTARLVNPIQIGHSYCIYYIRLLSLAVTVYMGGQTVWNLQSAANIVSFLTIYEFN